MKLNTNLNPNLQFGMGINRFLSNTKIRKWVWFRLLSVKILFSQNTFFIYWGLNLLGSGTWLSWLILTNVLLNWNCIYRLQRGTVTLAHARRCDGRYIGVVSSRHVVLTELVSSEIGSLVLVFAQLQNGRRGNLHRSQYSHLCLI